MEFINQLPESDQDQIRYQYFQSVKKLERNTLRDYVIYSLYTIFYLVTFSFVILYNLNILVENSFISTLTAEIIKFSFGICMFVLECYIVYLFFTVSLTFLNMINKNKR